MTLQEALTALRDGKQVDWMNPGVSREWRRLEQHTGFAADVLLGLRFRLHVPSVIATMAKGAFKNLLHQSEIEEFGRLVVVTITARLREMTAGWNGEEGFADRIEREFLGENP